MATPRQRLVILGAGGNSLSIIDAVLAQRQNPGNPDGPELVGILDDIPGNHGTNVHGVPVLGSIDRAPEFDGCVFINGIASANSYPQKPNIVARAGVPQDRFLSVFHPSAVISSFASVGRGTAIMANSVVCADAKVGDHVIVLQNSVINHHAALEDFVTVSSTVTILGYVNVGRNAFIGGGAALAPYVRIGPEALVGMGSAVIRDVPTRAVVAGNPGRVLRMATTNAGKTTAAD